MKDRQALERYFQRLLTSLVVLSLIAAYAYSWTL
jgi:hypothetical protein